jgi:hypothetical protein
LGRASGLVVCSQNLERIALDIWQQPKAKVHRIPMASAPPPIPPNRVPTRCLIKRQGELWLGTLAGLRPVKNLPRLVRALRACRNRGNW